MVISSKMYGKDCHLRQDLVSLIAKTIQMIAMHGDRWICGNKIMLCRQHPILSTFFGYQIIIKLKIRVSDLDICYDVSV